MSPESGAAARRRRRLVAQSARRAGVAVLTLLVASVVIFGVLHCVPGDPASILAGPDASASTIAAIRHQLGLDDSLVVQYLRWLGQVATGRLGRSYVIGGNISDLVASGLRNTAALGLSALVIAVVVALFGSISVVLWPRAWYVAVVGAFEVLTIAVPTFVTGVILVELFAVVWPILPAGGVPPAGYFAHPDITVQYLLLPAVCLALPVASTLTRYLSESLRTELARPYVLTARAAGISQYRIVMHGALRNALPSTVTVLGIQVGQLLGSAILVEAIFAWPGMGQLLAQGINARDYPVVQAVLLVAVAIFIVTLTVTDVAHRLLDPTRGSL